MYIGMGTAHVSWENSIIYSPSVQARSILTYIVHELLLKNTKVYGCNIIILWRVLMNINLSMLVHV